MDKRTVLRALFAVLSVLLGCGVSYAQNTTVNATIIDPNGNAYANGTVSAQTVVPTGQASTSTTPVNLNTAGVLSIVLPSTKTYVFTICGSPVVLGPRANPTPTQLCFTSPPIFISGASQDITSAVGTPAILGPAINSISGNAATATALQNTPTQCGAGNVATGIAASGNANCGAPPAATGSIQCNIAGFLGACPDITDVANVVTSTATTTVTNALQSTTFTASGAVVLNSSATIAGLLAQNGDSRFKGPNPWVDVASFGARTVSSGSIPTTTATINSGSASATLANGSSFVNGDGVRIDNAGATISLTTPSAPTVQSVLMGGPIESPQVANANAGSTTYGPYQIVARTKLGGWTIASAGGSTTTGPAALGIVATTISSTSLSGTTVTVNTTAPSDIVAGAMIWQPASGNQPWSGLFKVGATNSTTQFTYAQQGLDSIGAVPTMSSGTINYIVCNHVTWPAVTNAFQYWVYLNNALIGVVRPGETYYDDCGPTIRGTPVFPAYAPTTAPVAASPDPLVTTIVSGGTTNNVVLAATAGNTVAGARVVFDDAPTIKAAYNSVYSAASGNPLYFSSPNPPTRNAYIINSYLDLTAVQQLNVIQAAPIFINETIAVPSGTYWEGLRGVAGASPPGFGWGQYRQIQTNAALPGLYVNGIQVHFDGLEFDGNHDQALSVLVDSPLNNAGFNVAFTRCYFSTQASAGTATVDYTSMGIMTRGVKNFIMDRVSLVSQMQNNLAMGPWAGVYTGRSDLPVGNNTGQNFISRLFTASKGIVIDYTGSFSDMQGEISGYYTQGGRTPLLTLSGGNSIPGTWKIALVECDTTGVPILTNLTTTGFLSVDFQNNSGASPGCTNLSGNVVASITGAGSFQDTSSAETNAYTAADGTRGQTFSNRIVNVKGTGTFIHGIGAYPTAPTLALVAGGSWSVASHCFIYQWYDILFNGGNLSPQTCITTTPGNQSIQITVGTPPLGAFGFFIYGDVGGGVARRSMGSPDFCSPKIQNGLARIDTGGGTCGPSALPSAGMGDSGIQNQNIFSPSFTIIDPNNTGFTDSTGVPIPLTANRTINLPDQSGVLVLTGNLQSTYDGFNRTDGPPGANWTAINAGGVSIVSNQVKGSVAAAGSYASSYTGTLFQKDQYAMGTVVNLANGETGITLRNYGYDCTESGTLLLLHKSFSATALNSTSITGASGDVILGTARGTTITCMRFVAGVLTNTISATDSTSTSGAPGVTIRQFNGALTNALDDFFAGNIDPLAQLDNEQAWTSTQHFVAGFNVGTPPTAPVLISEQGNSGKIQQAGTVGNSLPMCSDANGNTTTSCSGVTTPLSTAYLTSNYTNATTTMSNVTGLSFPVAANTKYKVRCDLDYQTSATTADVQLQWTGPASPTFVTYDMLAEVTGSSLSAAVATAFSTALSETGTPTITTNFPLTLTMTLSNGANAGTIQLQAAATGVGTITIIPGSCSAQQ